MEYTRGTILDDILDILDVDDKDYFERCKDAVEFFDFIVEDKDYTKFISQKVKLNGYYYTKSHKRRYKKIDCLCTHVAFVPTLDVIQFKFVPFSYQEGVNGCQLGATYTRSF